MSYVLPDQPAMATVIKPATDEFYGRQGKLGDPFGQVWSFVRPKSA